jgi:NEDD8-activating enzyme E1 regulatory subunit
MQEREGNGALPLEGSIPDMTATTDMYLTLQRIYRAKADEHCQAVLAHAIAIASDSGRATDDLSLDKVKLYCKNARHLTVVRPSRIPGSAADLNAATLRQVCHS